MKSAPKIILLIIVFNSIFIANAQTNFPEPDFSNVPMYYDEVTKELKNLERPQVNVGMRATGFTSGEQYVYIEGLTSTVKFSQEKQPVFIFKTSTPSEDPQSVLNLVKMQVNDHKGKTQREYILAKAGMAGAKSTVKLIGLDFQRIKPGIYRVVLGEELGAGEYVFSDPNKTANPRAFAFSIVGGGVKAESQTSVAKTTPSSVGLNVQTNTTSTPSSSVYPEPDFENLVYYFNSATNELVDLERAVNAKSEGAFGFLNLNSSISISGVSSPVKITTDAKNSFIVKLSNSNDPYTVIELLPCTLNEAKQTRDYSPASKKGQPATTATPLKFKRITGNMYAITTLEPLAKGNYFFINKSLKEKSIFAFEVK